MFILIKKSHLIKSEKNNMYLFKIDDIRFKNPKL